MRRLLRDMGAASLVGLLTGTAVFWGVPMPAHAYTAGADDLPDGDADLPDGDEDAPTPKPAPKNAKPAKPEKATPEKPPAKPSKPEPKPAPADPLDDLAPPPEERTEDKPAPAKPSRMVEDSLEEDAPPKVAAQNPKGSGSRDVLAEEPEDEFLSSKPKPKAREVRATSDGAEATPSAARGAVGKADEGNPLFANPWLYVAAGGIAAGGFGVVVVVLLLTAMVVGGALVVMLNPGGILNMVPNPFGPKTGTVRVKVN
jgi:hypothetical protein